MRPRFLGIVGPVEAVGRLTEQRLEDRLTPQLTLRAHTGRLLLFGSPTMPMLGLPEDRGVLIGRIFAAGGTKPLGQIGPSLGEEILSTRGQVLIDRYWGDYIVLGDDGRGGSWALRDPSGAMPLYRSDGDGLLFFFSDLGDPLGAGLIEPAIDPQFPIQWLAYPALRTRRTGLAGVSEVLAGVRVSGAPAEMHEEGAWSPWRYASRKAALNDFDEARRKLRRELARVVPALTSGHENLLVELSGGLDSALVAAALGNAGRRFAGVNFATRASDGDERHYARAIAERLGAPLAELHEADTAIDLEAPRIRRLRPAFSPVVQPLHRAFADHAHETGAGAFLTGTGGDNVFCYLTTAAPIVDAVLSGRLWRAAAKTLPDVAAQCDCTIWTAARFAAARLSRGRRRTAWKRNTDFLVPETVPERPDPHPWLAPPRGTLPGKREHVEALVRIQHFLDPANREADLPFLNPLMAQPLLELCLTIPSWMWVTGGYNRAVARSAFEDLLPPAVVNRRTKGRLESMCGRWFVEARGRLREIVLDGALRRDRIVDGAALESYLARDGVPKDELYFRIFELAAVELWLASWRGRLAA